MTTIELKLPFLWFHRYLRRMVPQSWTEITGKQLITISEVVPGQGSDEVGFLSSLTGLNKKIINRLLPFIHYSIYKNLEFLTDSEPCSHYFMIKELPGTRFIAPAQKLSRMSFGQFIFCESYYSDWMKSQDPEKLYRFVASLYLEKGERFNPDSIELKVKSLKRVNVKILKAIAFNYSMVLRWLQRRYPMVFQEGKKQDDPEHHKMMETSVWVKLFESLVGEDLIHRDAYADLPVHAVLKYLSRKYVDSIKN